MGEVSSFACTNGGDLREACRRIVVGGRQRWFQKLFGRSFLRDNLRAVRDIRKCPEVPFLYHEKYIPFLALYPEGELRARRCLSRQRGLKYGELLLHPRAMWKLTWEIVSS